MLLLTKHASGLVRDRGLTEGLRILQVDAEEGVIRGPCKDPPKKSMTTAAWVVAERIHLCILIFKYWTNEFNDSF